MMSNNKPYNNTNNQTGNTNSHAAYDNVNSNTRSPPASINSREVGERHPLDVNILKQPQILIYDVNANADADKASRDASTISENSNNTGGQPLALGDSQSGAAS